MVWVKLDDHFHDHEKVAALEPRLMLEAIGLNTLAWSWCGRHLTDGMLPKGQPARLAGRPVENLIAELVRVGLWERCSQGFQIHDYLDYNPSRAHVEATALARKEGGKLGAERRWRSESDRSTHRPTHGSTHSSEMPTPIGQLIGEAIGPPMGQPMPPGAIGQPIGPGCPESRIPSSIEDIEGANPVDNFRDVDFGEDPPEDRPAIGGETP